MLRLLACQPLPLLVGSCTHAARCAGCATWQVNLDLLGVFIMFLSELFESVRLVSLLLLLLLPLFLPLPLPARHAACRCCCRVRSFQAGLIAATE